MVGTTGTGTYGAQSGMAPAHDRISVADGADGGAGDDGVLVLPWWQRPANIFTLLLATALIAAMAGWLVRDTTADNEASDVDVGFLHDMRVHHEQAFQMGMIFLGRPDTDPRLQTVAGSIVFGQSIEIGRMIQLLRDFDAPEARDNEAPAMTWMGMSMPGDEMPGMATEQELDALGAATGPAADRLFVELMTAHHEGGIEMAEAAVELADDDEIVAFARSLADSQRDEILEMQGLQEG